MLRGLETRSVVIKVDSHLQLSASDLVGHLNCHHLTQLNLQVAQGARSKPEFWDPNLEILWERGAAHERAYVQHLRESGREIVEIEGVGITPTAVEQTVAAMRAGADVIVQAAFLDGVWSGRADVLLRVNAKSDLGDWSYEVADTKLARQTKGGTVLQLCLYSDLLAKAQGLAPEHMYVVTPASDFKPIKYRTAAYAAYYRQVRRALEQTLAAKNAALTYPEPREHCDVCRWRVDCETKRRADDHLSLVAGISGTQIAELTRRKVTTLAELACVPVPLPWKPERGLAQSYERSREQARVQLEGRLGKKSIYETLPPLEGVGLQRLPEPSRGDIFLDLEADPFVGDVGLEYLFGYVWQDEAGMQCYSAEWAFDRDEEKRAFERFVDFVMARWAKHPGLHIYHYAPYEPSALKRLMGRYATREDEIDRMLRGGLFIDLYAVAKQSIRASVESYTIKNLEVFYGFERKARLADVRPALAKLQARLELGHASEITQDLKDIVVQYNQDDCLSALKLRGWLEELRAKLIAGGEQIPRPPAGDPEPAAEIDERQRQVAALVERLTADVPTDRELRTNEQHARWILAHLLDWHRREQKSAHWEFFRLADLPEEGFFDERRAVAGLTFVAAVGGTKKAPIHRYRFPPQEFELRGGEELHIDRDRKLGSVEAVSLEDRTIDIKKRGDTADVHPGAAFSHKVITIKEQAAALLRLGTYVAENGVEGIGPYQAARDLLLRLPPRLHNHPLLLPGESPSAAAVRIAPIIGSGVLPIQGPPGAGKTFTGAQMISALVKANKRVGVTANSHEVIRNLLAQVVEAGSISCVHKVSEKAPDVSGIRFETDNEKTLAAIGTSCQVGAGTAWLWSRKDAAEVVDVLFIDEAAQMSLANALAVSQACKTLVLLGDPQQLEQPIQGSHPEGTDVSALDHILQGAPTIDEQQGLFLNETWRLHPDICDFTSELFYESRLHYRADLVRQRVISTSRVSGTGLRFLPVAHEGNQNASVEEAAETQRLVEEILASKATWMDRDGIERPVGIEDILIIAPYNAQVFEIRRRLPNARVGTVDKFQGQEAPIVIYSVTTSSHADAPRGMEFLYSLNRLNVAVSRAKCVCVLIASPAIFEPVCATPRQMELANAYCRYRERAKPLGQ
jgi:predicted RecB family nuclease